MNLAGVRQYYNELNALLERVDAVAGAIHQMTAMIRAADAAGERQQQLQMTQQRTGAEQQLKLLEAALSQHTKAVDVESARTLRADIAARIDAANEEFGRWRRMLADFDFEVSEGTFVPDPETPGEVPTGYTRGMAEAELEKSKGRVTKRVELASQMVPDRAVVLL